MLRNDEWEIEDDAIGKIKLAADRPCTCPNDGDLTCVSCRAKTYQLWIESRATIMLKKLRQLYADTA